MVQEDGSLAHTFIRQGSESKQAGKKEALIEQTVIYLSYLFLKGELRFLLSDKLLH